MTDGHAPSMQQQSDGARQLRDQARERAEQMREAAEHRREALEHAREAARAAREAAQEAGRIVVPMPPMPPLPPQGRRSEIVIAPDRPWDNAPAIPPEVVDIVGMLTFGTAAVLILRPLMRAFANRFERRGASPPALSPEVTAQITRLEQAVEAVAIEVERISEGQRYTTKLLSERVERR